MYLASLDLFGFKSFAQKTRIEFSPGVTAVVGPNGCGKSNLVDAVRWVLGEQRESLLRSERMENVIFTGTEKRKPLGMAEISLTLQDADGILPVEYDEVTVTRRLYRSGKSEYLLNKSICRLKDLVDLFMDTGIGPDSYSIIELKMVEGIISEDPEEMRRLFDEATGITRYKARRKEALRRLVDARQDRERAFDILQEVEKHANSLKRQVGKVRSYKRLQERIRSVQSAIIYKRVCSLEEQLTPLNESLEKLTEQEQLISGKLNASEAEAVKIEKEILELEDQRRKSAENFNVAQADYQEISQKKAHTEEQLRLDDWRRNNNRKEKEKILQEVNFVNEKVGEADQLKIQAEKVLPELAVKLNSIESEFSEADSKFKEARLKSINSRDSLNSLRSREADVIRASEARKATIESHIERFNELRRNREAHLEALQKDKRGLIQHEGELREKSVELDELKERRLSITEKINTVRERVRSGEDELNRIQVHGDSLIMKIEHFKELHRRSSPLFSAGGAAASEFPDDISAVLTDELLTESNNVKAVENALMSMAYSRVINISESFNTILQFLKREKTGRAALLLGTPPETDISAVRDFAAESSGIVLAEVIKGTSKAAHWIRYLVHDVVLLDNIEDVYKHIANAKSKSISLVTRGGEFTDCNGLWIIGETGDEPVKSIGVSERLEDLARLLRDTELKRETMRQELIESQKELRASEDELVSLEKELYETEQICDIKNIQKLKLEAQLTSSDMKLLELDREIAELPARIEALKAENRSETDKLGAALNQLESLEKDIRSQQEAENSFLEARESIRLNLEKVQIESERAKSEARRTRDHSEELQQRSLRLKSRQDSLDSEAQELSSKIERNKEILETEQLKATEAGVHANELKNNLDDIDANRKSLQETQRSSNLRVRELRNEFETISQKIHAAQIEKAQVETTLKEEKPKLIDIDVTELKDEVSDPEQLEALQRKLLAMEPLNLAAESEYAEQKQRLDFLNEQLSDLDEAEKSLEQTILTLNTEASSRFEAGFGRIRENFKSIFKEIFNGGDADFRLTHEDTLESRIEISASLAGKRTGSLSLLSGGEKALTAIALLFAIYMEKPSPFCILDEVDAPLDDENTMRFSRLLEKFTPKTQFLVVTHNKRTMEVSRNLLGVTMEEEGISKVVPVQLN